MPKQKNNTYLRIVLTIFIVFTLWLVFDRATKSYFNNGQFQIGQQISDSILGVFHLTLVHNTGAAFGIFSSATIVLGIFSIIVSILLIAAPLYIVYYCQKNKRNYHMSFIALFSISIISAGGIGNAIDRLFHGYVVDFICFDFIDFPVFNIADIGVTCGAILLIIVLLVGSLSSKKQKDKTRD